MAYVCVQGLLIYSIIPLQFPNIMFYYRYTEQNVFLNTVICLTEPIRKGQSVIKNIIFTTNQMEDFFINNLKSSPFHLFV